MFNVYLSDDRNDGDKSIFIIGEDVMYVSSYSPSVYKSIMDVNNSVFIQLAGLESETLDFQRMLNPILIKTFN